MLPLGPGCRAKCGQRHRKGAEGSREREMLEREREREKENANVKHILCSPKRQRRGPTLSTLDAYWLSCGVLGG